ncbi:hypothetical protein SCHPADRAFT_946903 [Schizopora paradoxa]|uniref:F-box domain-containing protein n=1 Tax=Schizopora paradoxa TaxID=27342 RepID=A0A0H2R7L6_9AGAM|nr:hypothetical protein SCHPADRAFT_946903 [Schizopora paradoxa]
MENVVAIQTIQARMGTNRHSFTIDSFSVLRNLHNASVSLWPQLRVLSILKIALVVEDGYDEEAQINVLYILSGLLWDFARARMLQELELELTGFELGALCFLSEELADYKFTRLNRFASTTFPHSLLTPFLSINTTLEILNIGDVPCQGHCPLRLPNLNSLASVRCSAICAKAIIPGKPVYHARVMDVVRTRIDPETPSKMFRALRSRAEDVKLTRLEITFAHTDVGIMDAVISVAPHVVHLGLIEVEDPDDSKLSPRRPWNHGKEWAKALKKLKCLESFKLMTARFTMPPTRPLPDVWYPRPRNLFKIPLGIHIWHQNIRTLTNVRHGWAWDETIMDYTYNAVPLPMGINIPVV